MLYCIFHKRFLVGIVCFGLGFCCSVLAVTPPQNSPLSLLVGYAPGGLADRLSRHAATHLSQEIKRPVTVKNISGANGVRAVMEVLQNPDGAPSLLFADSSLIIASQTTQPSAFDLSSFAPVGTMGFTPFAIAVPAGSPIQSLSDLIQFLREHPAQSNYGTPGIFSVHQLGAEMLFLRTNTRAQHIPYQGGAPMLADLLQQRLTFSLLSIQLAQQHLRQQQLRVLAVTGPYRSAQLASIPTLAETYPGLTTVSTAYLLASPNMERPLYQAIVAAWRRIMASKEMLPKLEESGMEGGMRNEQEAAALIRHETERWREVLRQMQSVVR